MAQRSKKLSRDKMSEVYDVCAYLNLRKASRAVTQMYDEALAPSGIRSTQMAVLVTVGRADSILSSRLATDLVMDRSSLTRTLQPLERQGLIKKTKAKDGRRIIVSLTKQGREAVGEALPHWTEAQNHLVSLLDKGDWDGLLGKLGRGDRDKDTSVSSVEQS